MKNCLNCGDEFQEKKPTALYCSVSCRVMYNRKNSKDRVTKPQMQVIYNEILGLIQKAKSEPPPSYSGVATNSGVNWGQTLPELVKVRLKRPFVTLQALINECESQEQYEPLRKEIEEADHLTTREKSILLRKR